MKNDPTDQTIRRLAAEKGFLFDIEQITDVDGESRRFWFFRDRLGRPPMRGEGSGIQDQEALNFLQRQGHERRGP